MNLAHKIESPHNPRIKSIVRLRKAAERQKQQRTIVEGVREVTRALQSSHPLKQFFICSELLEKSGHDIIMVYATQNGCEVFDCSLSVFKKISYREHPDGLIALAPLPQKKLTDLKLSSTPLVLIAENIEKPGNIGTLLRTADAVGVDAIILINPRTDLTNPNVIRASMGSLFLLPIISTDLPACIQWLQLHQIQSIGLIPDAPTDYTQMLYAEPSAIVVGSEDGGLSSTMISSLSHTASIPMVGHNDSLNVATAAAITLYEAVRQRRALH
jgi:TrmH family RNA methyltransferase